MSVPSNLPSIPPCAIAKSQKGAKLHHPSSNRETRMADGNQRRYLAWADTLILPRATAAGVTRLGRSPSGSRIRESQRPLFSTPGAVDYLRYGPWAIAFGAGSKGTSRTFADSRSGSTWGPGPTPAHTTKVLRAPTQGLKNHTSPRFSGRVICVIMGHRWAACKALLLEEDRDGHAPHDPRAAGDLQPRSNSRRTEYQDGLDTVHPPGRAGSRLRRDEVGGGLTCHGNRP